MNEPNEVPVKHIIQGSENSSARSDFDFTTNKPVKLYMTTGRVPDLAGGKSFWRRIVPLSTEQKTKDNEK